MLKYTISDMRKNDTIFTLNARDNILLDVSFKDSSPEKVHEEINKVFDLFIDSLESKGIDYKKLKNCLIPSRERKEIALVFDIVKSGFSMYGYIILSKILSILGKESSHSFLIGDYSGEQERKVELHSLFYKYINPINPTDYKYHSQYFLVYLNNLSKKMVQNLTEGLQENDYFTGYFDVTYSNKIKSYLSLILVPKFIKHNSFLVALEPFETSVIDKIEDSFCDYEELGFICKYVHSSFYHIFLSYKIEREVLPSFESDTLFSLHTLSGNFLNLVDCDIEIETSKLNYLHKEKIDNIQRAGLINLSFEELEGLIKKKLESNYIYNLAFLEKHNTLKFNILIEVPRIDAKSLMKLLVVLEYKPNEKKLRLITMY